VLYDLYRSRYMLIEQQRIDTAFETIQKSLALTPLIRSLYLSRKLGANVWLKLETLQPTHSFKVRGALNAISRLPQQRRARGVVTASGGNHGLAIAYTAQTAGIPATVYLPRKSSPDRIQAIESLDAKVVLHGESWDESNAEAREMARETGATYIHPFDDVNVMAGQATIVSELVSQIPRIDLLIASIGGGGLLSGLISAASAYSPATRVVGVETEGADSMYQSWRAGEIVELPAITSIAETLGARKTGQRQFDIITRHASELVTVSDQQAIDALIELLTEEKLLTEPATSCSVAALLTGKVAIKPDENVVIVLCGANAGMLRISEWITAATRRAVTAG
jgi:threonine dehydratase